MRKLWAAVAALLVCASTVAAVTNYPGAVDTVPVFGTAVHGTPVLATTINNIRDALLAVETKLGKDASSTTTTVDYLLKSNASIDPGHQHTGASLSAINAATITTGTLADARLTANIARLGTSQTWSASQVFSGGLAVGTKFIVDVNGNITKINNVASSWPGVQGAALSFLQNDGTGVYSWVTIPATTPGGSPGAVQFNLSGAFTGDSSNFFWDNTNKFLGIHNGAPGTFLDVWGDGAFRASTGGSRALSVAVLGTLGRLRLAGGASGDELQINSGVAGSFLTLYSGAAERVRVAATGRVGIGTTSPSALLDVSGFARGAFQDRGGAVYNLYAYEAVGDDVADDTVPVDTMFSQPSLRRAAFNIPPGTFRYSNAIRFPAVGCAVSTFGPGAVVQGAGTDKTVLHYTGTGWGVIIGDGTGTQCANHITFNDLTIEWDNVSQGGALLIDPSNNATFNNVRFVNSTNTSSGIGVLMEGSVSCNCTHSYSHCAFGAAAIGMRFSGFANSNHVYGANFNNTTTGITFSEAAANQACDSLNYPYTCCTGGGTGSGVGQCAADTGRGDTNVVERAEFDGPGITLPIEVLNTANSNAFYSIVTDGPLNSLFADESDAGGGSILLVGGLLNHALTGGATDRVIQIGVSENGTLTNRLLGDLKIGPAVGFGDLFSVNGTSGNVTTVSQFISTLAIGTAPLVVTSTTKVSNLNVDLFDGLDSTAFAILAGQSGGQTLNGDTAASGNLTLSSTAHATKGKILFGTSAYDELNNRLGIGTNAPLFTLHLKKAAPSFSLESTTTGSPDFQFVTTAHSWDWQMDASGNFIIGDEQNNRIIFTNRAYPSATTGGGVAFGTSAPTLALATGQIQASLLRGTDTASGTLTLSSTAHATKGKILFGASSAYDEANVRLGIGTASPATTLEVDGSTTLGTGGTPITKHLSATASLDFGATAAGTCDSLTITVTGAVDGDTVACGIPNALAASDTYQSFQCFVSSSGVVTVKRCNLLNLVTALSDPSAATVRADVWQH
jgi:hypothetical protein